MAELESSSRNPSDSRGQSDGLIERLVSVRRTASVNKGGRTFRISAAVVVGDRKGRIGFGMASDKEAPVAIQKALADARKNMRFFQFNSDTLYHTINSKFGATKVFMKPAGPGTGIIAGGAMRLVFDVVGIKDVLAKIYGSTNPINVVRATFKALESMASPEKIKERRRRNVYAEDTRAF